MEMLLTSVPRFLVISDDDQQKAETLAQKIGEDIWSIREEITAPRINIDEALDQAMKIKSGPVVLADVADNAGGGAPSDSTFIF